MDLIQGAFPFAEGRTVRRVETPAARRTDPESSHLAAKHVTASGVRQAQQQAAYAAPKDDNGNPILRACTKTGRVAMTWEPIVQ